MTGRRYAPVVAIALRRLRILGCFKLKDSPMATYTVRKLVNFLTAQEKKPHGSADDVELPFEDFVRRGGVDNLQRSSGFLTVALDERVPVRPHKGIRLMVKMHFF